MSLSPDDYRHAARVLIPIGYMAGAGLGWRFIDWLVRRYWPERQKDKSVIDLKKKNGRYG